jgi:hypothetical protein
MRLCCIFYSVMRRRDQRINEMRRLLVPPCVEWVFGYTPPLGHSATDYPDQGKR